MPIRPELRHFYQGPEWEATRKRILERAKNKCEQCGKRNHRKVWTRFLSGRMWWSTPRTRWRNHLGELSYAPRFYDAERRIRVVLTVAHLNHKPGDDRDENLKALCQWCHLNYDKLHHKETRSIHKDEKRPLLQEATA